MTRDEKLAKDLERLSSAASRAYDAVCNWRQEALDSEAIAHSRLYQRVSDELSDAMGHLDCAWTLMDPKQTDVEETFGW